MNCHHCKQPIPEGQEKHIRILGRTIVAVHQNACPEQDKIMNICTEAHIRLGSDVPCGTEKPKTFKSFAEAVQYIDENKFPRHD